MIGSAVLGRCAAILAADLVLLGGQWERVIVLLELMSAPHAWVGGHGTDAAAVDLCAGLLWCVGAWLALALLVAVATGLPGTVGAAASHVLARVAPAALVRIVAGAAGMSVLISPAVGASAAVAPPAPAVASAGTSTHGAAAVPSPVLPTSPSRHRPAVLVRAGDSLWRIAAARLRPGAPPTDIAGSVARWYATNRGTVGPDADLIHPGQRLLPPNPPEQP